MEENQHIIQIHQSHISPNLLLNLQNNNLTTNKSQHFHSYFSVVQKFRKKSQQRIQQNKKKNGFVEKFYQKLKKDLQNSTDQKSLEQNLCLMNICLKHKHTRNPSQTLPNTHRSRNKPLQATKRQLPFQQTTKQPTIFYTQTNRIINECQQQNKQLSRINKKMGLFRYYNNKLSRNLYNSQLRIKKSEIQY